MMCWKETMIALVLLICAHGVNSYSYKDMGNLMDDLFNTTRYNKDVRPIVNQSDAIEIFITQMLFYIEDVKLTSGDILTRSMILSVWRDEMATWSPEEYGGIQKISVPKGRIWTPDIVLAKGEMPSISDSSYSFLYMKNTGNVLQVTVGYLQTKCLMDSTYYPFDSHSCAFEYLCQHYDANEVALTSGPNMFLHDYTENSEWAISAMTSESVVYEEKEFEASASILNVNFNVSRRHGYATTSTVLPGMLLTVIAPFASLIPVNLRERLSFLTTLLMAVVFMYTAFVDIMPRDSLHMSYFLINFIFVITLHTVNTIWNVFVVRISTWSIEKHHIPSCFKRLSRCNVGKTKVANISDTLENINDDDRENDTDRRVNEQESRDLTWTDVAGFLDKVAFVTQWIIIVVVSIGYKFIIANGKQ